MAVDERNAGLRRKRRRPAEQADLTAMGVTGQLERDARGHARCDIGLMREQDDRRVFGDLCERRGEIVGTEAPSAAVALRRRIGELIAEAGEPERATILG